MDIGTATNEPGAKDGGKPKIIPFLWFDHQPEEAARFYASAFDNSKIGTVVRYGDGGPGPKGSVMTVSFELAGQRFAALNGWPAFRIHRGHLVPRELRGRSRVDALWDKLSEGGEKRRCGWLKDKFGVSWQIVPSVLQDLLHSPDPGKSSRVMQAMLKMTKLDIAALGRAYSDPATDPGLCG